MAVSPSTEAKLRAALTRLLDGQPQHTDGALTKENLAREAGVSHATVHRATDILTEWNARVPRSVRRTPSERARDDTINTLRVQLTQARQSARQLQGRLDALATVTAHLYAENRTLRRRLDMQPHTSARRIPLVPPISARTDASESDPA
ncbi:hypothetical protein [Streptomyces werraensis]|uniref:hypothetical protein n=1 Tax=Streptomyces werraensis TaxID=68284 RepID=UPI0034322093